MGLTFRYDSLFEWFSRGSQAAKPWNDWSAWSGLHPVPVLFCTACVMFSINTSWDPTCTVPADAGTFKCRLLAIADAQIKVSRDHTCSLVHDVIWAVDDNGQPVTDRDHQRQSWIQSASPWALSAWGSSMEMVTYTASPLHSITVGAATPKTDWPY